MIEAVYAKAKHNFEIEQMFELDVHHMLLVRKGITAPHINTFASHDQALKQCLMYLMRMRSEFDIVPYAYTAKVAEDLASGTLPDTTAVIAPHPAAELY